MFGLICLFHMRYRFLELIIVIDSMYNKLYIIFIIGLCKILFQVTLLGQFYTQPGGFIERDLFFKPASVTPIYSGLFEDIATGFSDHILQEAMLNPARLGDNVSTQNYFYVDYRTIPSIKRTVSRLSSQRETREYVFGSLGFPRPVNTIKSKIDEPRFTAAWIYRPSSIEKLSIGIIYRQLHASDPYYDHFVKPMTRQKDGRIIPLYSVKPGDRDRFRNLGYFPSVLASVQISDALTTGLRLSIIYYTGNGNLIDGQFFGDEIGSIDRGVEQTYIQWEAVTGANLKLSGNKNFGISAGVLYSDVAQSFGIDHFYAFKAGERNVVDQWRSFKENLSVDQSWNRDGFRYFGTVEMRHFADQNKSSGIRIFYTLDYSSVKMNGSGYWTTLLFDEYRPFGATEVHHINRAETHILEEIQTTGTRSLWGHRIGITRQMLYGPGTELLIGFQFNRLAKIIQTEHRLERVTETESEIVVEGELISSYDNREITDNFFIKEKDRIATFNIPVLLRLAVSGKFSLEGGFLVQYVDQKISQHIEGAGSILGENIEGSNIAGMLGFGYAISPGIAIRLTGVTGISYLNNNQGAPIPGSLIVDNQKQIIGSTRFMIGLEAGF